MDKSIETNQIALIAEAWRMLEEALHSGCITLKETGEVVQVGSQKGIGLLLLAKDIAKRGKVQPKKMSTAEDFILQRTNQGPIDATES